MRTALKLALAAPACAALTLGAATGLAQGPQYEPGPGGACQSGTQAPFTPAPRTGHQVKLTVQQLLINQRIDQAGINRANSLKAFLDGNITRDYIRDSSLCPAVYGGIGLTGTATGQVPGPFSPRKPIAITNAPRSGDTLQLTAEQLLINQRISQAVIIRANTLRARLAAKLTGGDVTDGAITAAKNLTGLSFGTILTLAPQPGTSGFTIPTPPRSGDQVRLTAQQLLINQRISQAAINRLNAIRLKLETGLTGGDFKIASITVVDLDPSLRPAS